MLVNSIKIKPPPHWNFWGILRPILSLFKRRNYYSIIGLAPEFLVLDFKQESSWSLQLNTNSILRLKKILRMNIFFWKFACAISNFSFSAFNNNFFSFFRFPRVRSQFTVTTTETLVWRRDRCEGNKIKLNMLYR